MTDPDADSTDTTDTAALGPVAAGAPPADESPTPLAAGNPPQPTEESLLTSVTPVAVDWAAGEAVAARLVGWGGAPGALADLARWIGSVRGAEPVPDAFTRVRLVVFAADHGSVGGNGGLSAGRALLAGEGLLPLLAARAGVSVRLVDAGLAGEPLPGPVSADRVVAGSPPLDRRDPLTPAQVEAALALGARIADDEIDAGTDLLIPAMLTDSAIVPATVLIAALCEVEPVRALGYDAYLSDQEWIRRCAAVRDGLRRVRQAAATLATRRLLVTAGGADLAAAAGLLVRSAARRTPALIDGVGAAAAALVARALAPDAPGWWCAPHGSGRAGEQQAFTALRLRPVTETGTRLADGAGALLTLPLLTAAAELAATAPSRATSGRAAPGPAAPATSGSAHHGEKP